MADQLFASKAQEFVATWPKTAREAAETMMDRYGQPDEATPTRLTWFRRGPWKRIEVHKEEVPHRFPKPHGDVLLQAIDYRVPLGRFDEVARFDGSVLPDRTRGELTARCDKEEMNILALNIADQICRGRRKAADARELYAEQAMLFMSGQDAPYTERLRMRVRSGATADKDRPMVMRPMARTITGKSQRRSRRIRARGLPGRRTPASIRTNVVSGVRAPVGQRTRRIPQR